MNYYFIVMVFVGCGLPIFSQNLLNNKQPVSADSVSELKARNKSIYSGPRKAALMSTLLPGLGQIYNKKVWKVPIVYVGLGGFAYMFAFNNQEYKFYRKNLIAEYDNDSTTVNTTFYSGDQLQQQKYYYRKYRDFAIIGMGAIYLLNIIDAHVDAHLSTFDVSDDLSLRIAPWEQLVIASSGTRLAAGISLQLHFK